VRPLKRVQYNRSCCTPPPRLTAPTPAATPETALGVSRELTPEGIGVGPDEQALRSGRLRSSPGRAGRSSRRLAAGWQGIGRRLIRILLFICLCGCREHLRVHFILVIVVVYHSHSGGLAVLALLRRGDVALCACAAFERLAQCTRAGK